MLTLMALVTKMLLMMTKEDAGHDHDDHKDDSDDADDRDDKGDADNER